MTATTQTSVGHAAPLRGSPGSARDGGSQVAIVMIAANLIVPGPLTPWDFGPYELLVAETMVLLGAERGEASGFAIGFLVLLQLWIAIIGLAAMWPLRLRPPDLPPRRHAGGAS